MSCNKNALEPLSGAAFLDFFATLSIDSNSVSRIVSPFLSVCLKLSSSLVNTPKMKSLFVSNVGCASPITSIAVSTSFGITNFSVPSKYAWRTARRNIRRSTYPRPSLDGNTPSFTNIVDDRACSASTRNEKLARSW